ncbi:putative chromatin remodeler Bromodomain family [Helianthus debilis subsp. tardiflorus]
MKRKRANGGQKRKTTARKNKLLNDVMNDEAGEPETNMSAPPVDKSLSNERTDENATSLEKYPTALREMIVSIIKEISQEPGGLANLSRSLVDIDSPVSSGPTVQPLEGNKSPLNQNIEYKEEELNAALTVIITTMNLDAADPFNRPVDPVELDIPDYFDVIKTPMDFGTICNNLKNGHKYMNSVDVFKDVQYIWYNCIKYNKKGDYILELMNRVKTFFMKHWIAAGLHTEQSTSVVEPSMHNEEHSGSPVTHVSDFSILRDTQIETDYPLGPLASIASCLQKKDAGSNQVAEHNTMPINTLAGQPQQSSSDPEYSPEQDEPASDATNIQKKRQGRGRGPTRCLKLLNTAGRVKIITNDLGQPVGREASLLTSFLGLTARNGNLAPLTYSSWSKVPEENKENMWQKVLTKFDIDPCSRSWVVKSLGTKWRNFKSLLKSTHYDTHTTDEERLADRDGRVLPDQWAVLVSQWSSEKWQRISAKNKANRARQKFNHTSGKKSFARIREEEKAKRPDGKEPSKAELFILTRTRKNGQPVNEETAAVISQLCETETNKEQSTINKNEPQDDAYDRVMGVDRKGSVSLLGLNATPSRFGSDIPTRAEALRMVSEKNAEVVEMKQKLASVEETCSQMAAQMSAMMSMMANMQKASPGTNFNNEVGGTSVPVSVPYQSEPISTSNPDVPSRQTRGRKKRT